MGRIYDRLSEIHAASQGYKPRSAEQRRKMAEYGPLAVSLGPDRGGRLGNTRIRRDPDGTLRLRFHDTDIVTARPDGTVVLWHGGWPTTTTAGRMNDALGQWAVSHTYRKFGGYGRHDQRLIFRGEVMAGPVTFTDGPERRAA